MEQVRVCQVCGHINPSDNSTRCSGCWAFLTQALAVSRADAEKSLRRFKWPFWRKRYLVLAMVLAMVLVVWKTVSLLDLVPLVLPPEGATTGIEATAGPHTWAHARYDFRNSGFTPDRAPVPEQVSWTFVTSGPLLASPAVAGDRVFLATSDGRTVSLNARTGQLIWEHNNGFPSNSTPVVTPETVISVDRSGRVVALDRTTGLVRWEREMKSPVTASPVVADGSLYLGSSDNNLYALDAATGNQRWAFATDAWINSTPAYADGVIAVSSQDTNVNIVNAKTGRQQLLYNAGMGRTISGGPAVQGDVVYFGSIDGRVWAVDRRAKTYPFQRTVLFWKANFYVWGLISAPVQRGTLWSSGVGGKILRSVAVAPDTVYAANGRGSVVALDALTGERRWQSDVENKITTSPTVAGRTVLVGTHDGLVFGLDRHSGEIMWSFKTGGEISAGPVVAGDTMYIVTHDGVLLAVTGT